ncbi:MAG: KilA-N domain-containing protein [Pseudomonas sp.]|nr:KilA-N domain-containing protein [Pseudomonas sp.]
MKQNQLALIPHIVEGDVIHQRAADGYINATAMCKSVNKRIAHYFENKATKEFLAELSSDVGIPTSGLIEIFKGGEPQNQGTWVHPDIAINLAQWLSPKFAVQVSRWVREWMTGGAATTELPTHLKRYMVNRSKIPHTHFSILNELTFNLVAPLEDAGYTLPDNLVPDISQGRIFSKWLRDNRNVEPKNFPSYQHEYPDGRIFDARLYPNEYLADFKQHFNEVWLPEHAPRYFKQRDAKALSLVTAILLPAPN